MENGISERESDFSGRYEEIEELFRNEMCAKILIRDTETSEWFIKHIIKSGGAGVYQQLIGEEHINIPGIYQVTNNEDDSFTVIEEYFEGVKWDEKLDNGVTADEFEDYILQLCDAVEFLSQQNPPIFHSDIITENILIGSDNLLKLTNLEYAGSDGSITHAIEQIGKVLNACDTKYTKKYNAIIRKCDGNYDNIEELRKEIFTSARPNRIKISVTIAAILFTIFRLRRVYSRIIRLLLH